MTQSLAEVLLHIVFTTKNRLPLINSIIESEFYAYICGVCRELKSPVIKINGVEDHIHILLSINKNLAVCKLITEIKSNSSRWIKTKDRQLSKFAWQSGYGAFSVSRSQISGVIKYIEGQKNHHKTKTFKEEFLMMLHMSGISYDENYLWD